MENALKSSNERSLYRICPCCSTTSIISDGNGEYVCDHCGLVVEDRSSYQGPEWFPGEGDVAKKRAGLRLEFKEPDMGLSTVIGYKNYSSRKRQTSLEKQRIERLRLWQYRINIGNSMLRNLDVASIHFKKLKHRLNLPDHVAEHGAHIYRKSLSIGLNRGRSTSVMATAALYAACRSSGTPHSLRDFTQKGNVPKKDLARCYRLIVKKLNLCMSVLPLTAYISAIGNRAEVSEKVKRRAIDLSEVIKPNLYAGKGRAGLAAAFLYLASVDIGEPITQKKLAQAAGVTDVTVGNKCRFIKNLFKARYCCDSVKLMEEGQMR